MPVVQRERRALIDAAVAEQQRLTLAIWQEHGDAFARLDGQESPRRAAVTALPEDAELAD